VDTPSLMTTYIVKTRQPGAFNGWYATVDRAGGAIQGTGYGATERDAIRRAWSDYWRKSAEAYR